MSRDEIIAMAREADPFGDDGRLVSLAMLTPGTLERFAALVAAKAAAKEREACAALATSWDTAMTDKLAAAIRARGNHGLKT